MKTLFLALIALGLPLQAEKAEGLLSPGMDRSLWGAESIPSVKHLDKKFTERKRNDHCAKEYRALAAKKPEVHPLSQSLDTLKKAVGAFAIPPRMLEKTLAVYLHNQARIPNQRYVAIFDHTQPSIAKRFVVLDLWEGAAKGYRSAHGMGSDPKHAGKAVTFGNDPRGNSNKSSVGCALTGDKSFRAKVTSQEPKGRWALDIFGFEDSNDKSCDRGVYMHAAPYVDYEKDVRGSAKIFASKPGRSWGCPAFTYHERDEIFDKISGGALLCAWAG